MGVSADPAFIWLLSTRLCGGLTERMNFPEKQALPLDPCRDKKHCHGAGEIDGQLRMPRFRFYRQASLAVGIAQPVSETGTTTAWQLPRMPLNAVSVCWLGAGFSCSAAR
jgi:hypothetical protein